MIPPTMPSAVPNAGSPDSLALQPGPDIQAAPMGAGPSLPIQTMPQGGGMNAGMPPQGAPAASDLFDIQLQPDGSAIWINKMTGAVAQVQKGPKMPGPTQ